MATVMRIYGKIGEASTQWASYDLAFSGFLLLTVLLIHLMQFRFGECVDYMIPSYLVNFAGIMTLRAFWTWDESVQAVPVRYIYKMVASKSKKLQSPEGPADEYQIDTGSNTWIAQLEVARELLAVSRSSRLPLRALYHWVIGS